MIILKITVVTGVMDIMVIIEVMTAITIIIKISCKDLSLG